MKPKKWFVDTLKSFEGDREFRLESIILNLTEKICERMKQKEITRAKLAELLGVSPPAVTKILNGSSNFTLKTLMALADVLELDLDVDFVERKKEMHVPETIRTSETAFRKQVPSAVTVYDVTLPPLITSTGRSPLATDECFFSRRSERGELAQARA